MKVKILKGLLYILLGYLLLIALHFIYLELGYGSLGSAEYKMAQRHEYAMMEMPSLSGSASVSKISNYATARFRSQDQALPAFEQKYEKIAAIRATTEKYDDDEKKIRGVINAHEALIQEEVSNSNNRHRWLRLTIGVPPGHFDDAVAALKLLGKTNDFDITKTDKTNDFLQLKAKRTSLEKARDSMMALKMSQGGAIDEKVKLEREILSLEEQIQGLGVQLGQFDKVNEFCTVRMSLNEVEPVITQTPHLGYLLMSMQWASTVYLALMGCFFVGILCIFFILIIAEKSKLFRMEES